MNTVLALVWLHFISDFILQSDKMAMSKSSSSKWLTIHVAVYGLPFLIVFGWKYALINALLHWITDALSSRATSYLWKKEKRHWFFVVIGFDQAIHLTCLLLTLPYAA
jgi:uncharacterized membrane protein